MTRRSLVPLAWMRRFVAAALLMASCGPASEVSSHACDAGVPMFAYTAPAKNERLRQSDVAVFMDGSQSHLTTDGLSSHPSFSPDAKSIVFSSGRGGEIDVEAIGYERLRLFIANTNGGKDEQLTSGP